MAVAKEKPLVISVGGGKGGVGKSVLAANLAAALARAGRRTALVDADLGAANQHTLFGIDRPKTTLQALLDREVPRLSDAAIESGVPNLHLLAGVSAVPGVANIPHAQRSKLHRHIARLDADVVVVDVGAGTHQSVLDFFRLGDVRLVVTSPQLPAIQNAYCFVKAALFRELRASLVNWSLREAFDEAWSRSETETWGALRRRAAALHPELDGLCRRATAGFSGWMVGNLVESPPQKKVLEAFSRMARDFLELELPLAALLPMSREVHGSVTERRPFVLKDPKSPRSQAMLRLASRVAGLDVDRIRRLRDAAGAPPDPAEASANTDPADANLVAYLRTHPRVGAELAANITRQGRVVACRVVDLSPSGARLVGVEGLRVGDRIAIDIQADRDLGPMQAIVRHVSGSGQEAGVELVASEAPPARRLAPTG